MLDTSAPSRQDITLGSKPVSTWTNDAPESKIVDVDVFKHDSSELSFLDPPISNNELGYLAHYRVIKVLGAGGMGVVLQAEDTHLKRSLALKVMRKEFVANEVNRERFLFEAQAAASVDSDYIVKVFQVGFAKDVPFLAMQLLHGEPLDVRLEREFPLPLPEALLIAKQVAEGLGDAHARKLVHRDIKPANVWLEHEPNSKFFKRIKLLDFGLARMIESNLKLTNAGMIVGTPQYMSPEQASGLDLDGRSDLFSLGTLLYVMLTGKLPFLANTAVATLLEIVTKEPPLPSQINRLVPKEIDQLVMKLLAKQPDDRPSTAREVVEMFDHILAEFSFTMPTINASLSGTPNKKETVPDVQIDTAREMENLSAPTDQVPVLQILKPVTVQTIVKEETKETQNPFAEFAISSSTHSAIHHGSELINLFPKRKLTIMTWMGFAIAIIILMFVVGAMLLK